MTDLTIRPAVRLDADAINDVHRAAFPTELEARIVESLIQRGQDAISLVAEVNSRIAGHLLFSPATIRRDPYAPLEELVSRTETTLVVGLGLAPLAVLPQFQRCGIGSALVRAGLDECRRLAVPWVIVLGDPAYYSRFGFLPARRWQLTCEFGGDEAFQILRIAEGPGEFPVSGGVAHYADAFRELLSQVK